ncbi:MAG TPA: phosphatidylserine decarboxylase [Candidatus Acidoferrum sp.]|nr:phosphatidylserine decarboxylase [Candidatus Acidoferrum sp.]
MRSAGSSVLDHGINAAQQKHRGRSWIEGLKVVAVVGLGFAFIVMLAVMILPVRSQVITFTIGAAWLICTAFVLFFFRDASPCPPCEPGVILSPSHGTVDYIDITTEQQFLSAPVRRISIYLSLLNVHVQHAPGSGTVKVLQHFPGRWSRAIRREASLRNEHLLVGLSCNDGHNIALRLISGIWVRRIVPWIACGQQVVPGERIGLIRFGSRVDIFLPLDAQVSVKPGDKVRGGETILARFKNGAW